MSLMVWAKRWSLSALKAFMEAAILEEAAFSARSAAWRSAAISSRTRRNWAAVLAMTTFILLLAHWRMLLSWAASCAASLERPAAASARALAAFLSKMATAASSSSRAFLAFSLIWAALMATCLLVLAMRALVAEARAIMARCWVSTAASRFFLASFLLASTTARMCLERAMSALLRSFWSLAMAANLACTKRMPVSRSSLAFLAFTAILWRSAFFSLERAALLKAKLRAIWARTAATSRLRAASSAAISFSTLVR